MHALKRGLSFFTGKMPGPQRHVRRVDHRPHLCLDLLRRHQQQERARVASELNVANRDATTQQEDTGEGDDDRDEWEGFMGEDGDDAHDTNSSNSSETDSDVSEAYLPDDLAEVDEFPFEDELLALYSTHSLSIKAMDDFVRILNHALPPHKQLTSFRWLRAPIRSVSTRRASAQSAV